MTLLSRLTLVKNLLYVMLNDVNNLREDKVKSEVGRN